MSAAIFTAAASVKAHAHISVLSFDHLLLFMVHFAPAALHVLVGVLV